MRSLLFITLFLLANSATAQSQCALPFDASFQVTRNGSELGEASMRVGPGTNGQWILTTQTRGTKGMAAFAGLEIYERSLFSQRNGKLETLQYDYTQSSRVNSRKLSIRVNPTTKKVDVDDRGKLRQLDHQDGAIDRHLVSLQLMCEMQRNNKKDIRLPVISRSSISEQLYRVVGDESLDTNLGRINTVKIERIRDNGDNRQTTIWLDKSRRYMPVRIEQIDEDDSMNLQIHALNPAKK